MCFPCVRVARNISDTRPITLSRETFGKLGGKNSFALDWYQSDLLFLSIILGHSGVGILVTLCTRDRATNYTRITRVRLSPLFIELALSNPYLIAERTVELVPG